MNTFSDTVSRKHAFDTQTVTRRRGTRDRSAKGYYRKQFEAAWASYCNDGTPAQPKNVLTGGDR
jgi:hypothetical protein